MTADTHVPEGDRSPLRAVGSGASRTGAPRSLLAVVRNLPPRWSPTVRLRRDGPLRPEFEALAPTRVSRGARPLDVAFFRGVTVLAPLERAWGRRVVGDVVSGTVWADTIVCWGAAVAAARRGLRALVVVREPPAQVARAVSMMREDERSSVEFVANSGSTAELVTSLLGVTPPVLLPTVSCPDPATVRAAARSLEVPALDVVGVGRADRHKGLADFAAVARRLGAQGRESAWVGDGPQLDRLRTATPRTITPGDVPDAVPWIASAKVLCVTSDGESFGRVAAEAASCRVPVVAYDVGGLREAAGPGAVYVDPGDVDRMVAVAEELLEDRDRRAALGDAGRAHVERTLSDAATRRRLVDVLGG